MKEIFLKSRIEKHRSFKTTKIGYSVPDLRKPNFNMKIIPFEECHNAGNCERGDPLRFFNIHSVAKIQKLKGDSLESLIKISRKKTKNEKF